MGDFTSERNTTMVGKFFFLALFVVGALGASVGSCEWISTDDQCYRIGIKLESPQLKRNQLIDTLPVIGPAFIVKLKLKVNSLPTETWTNLPRVAKGVNEDEQG